MLKNKDQTEKKKTVKRNRKQRRRESNPVYLQTPWPLHDRVCLHEKTRTSASFIPGWLFYFVSCLHDNCMGHFISRYLKVRFMLIKYTCDSESQTLRMRYPFQYTGRPMSHRNVWSFRAFTWYRCAFSYRSEILAPVQQPGWTHAGVTRAGMTFCGVIM